MERVDKALLELVWSFVDARLQCAVGNLVCRRFRTLVKRGKLIVEHGETSRERFEPRLLWFLALTDFTDFPQLTCHLTQKLITSYCMPPGPFPSLRHLQVSCTAVHLLLAAMDTVTLSSLVSLYLVCATVGPTEIVRVVRLLGVRHLALHDMTADFADAGVSTCPELLSLGVWRGQCQVREFLRANPQLARVQLTGDLDPQDLGRARV